MIAARALMEVTRRIADLQRETLHRQIPKGTTLHFLAENYRKGRREQVRVMTVSHLRVPNSTRHDDSVTPTSPEQYAA
eukprot:5562986-Pyramimonas_sp.AAC.3